MIDLEEINTKVIDYMQNNGLCLEEAIAEEKSFKLYNYSAPQYEEEKESIYKLLEDFYKVLGYSVIMDIEQLENEDGEEIGERMTIELIEE